MVLDLDRIELIVQQEIELAFQGANQGLDNPPYAADGHFGQLLPGDHSELDQRSPERTPRILGRDRADCRQLLRIDAALMDQTSTACQLRFNQVFVQTLISRLERTSERLSEELD